MNAAFQLPGQVPPPAPQFRGGGFWLVLAAVVVAACLLVLTRQSGTESVTATASVKEPTVETVAVPVPMEPVEPPPEPRVISFGEAEDLLRHLENATGSAVKAADQAKRSEDLITRTLPRMESYYLRNEKKRLESARMASHSSRKHVEEAREQFEIVKNLLLERAKHE